MVFHSFLFLSPGKNLMVLVSDIAFYFIEFCFFYFILTIIS